MLRFNMSSKKGWFTIFSGIKMNYTPEMEKAMQQSHNMNFAEYGRKLNKRLAVEKRRQKEYQKSKYIYAEMESHLPR
ncbi:hypothetical protein P5G51_007175 [Virgibacillus sp. 179-BFC.A HS]|uniref:Uncharacterized protein n=1 Tax=Tigheibacillus jepli TaxID=3035914 RepID=A0ABU5CG81_9BACI|nr:hypothetical protein [Virgibacillus sp. 179-BFC.A HS]MDY0405215.1 hypothetical protein [Virgibacillus sp. 179-BFC.A HS]